MFGHRHSRLKRSILFFQNPFPVRLDATRMSGILRSMTDTEMTVLSLKADSPPIQLQIP